jgi:tetratricopeptide (TPR) repeat protein
LTRLQRKTYDPNNFERLRTSVFDSERSTVSIDRAKALKAAQKYLAKGQLDRAIVEYEQVVALDPKDPRSLLKLGDLYTRVGDNKKAVATYRKVALQYGDEGFFLKAVAVHKQILKLEPGNLDAWEKLGEMYEALTLTSDAVATYEQVAEAAARLGKSEVALRALGRASEVEPENVAAAIRYAEALSKADKIEDAIEAFRRGADLLKKEGRLEDYMKVTERLLFHSHDDVERARELSELYLDRERAKQALSHLQTCFKHDPRDPRTLLLLGRAFEQLGQGPKAASVYRELVRVHAQKNEAAEELAALERLLGVEPEDPLALRRKAELESANDEDVIIVDEASAAAPRPKTSRPPSSNEEVEIEVARLLAECEVFERYRLRDRYLAQLKKIVLIAPRHALAREKLASALGESREAAEHWLALGDIVAAGDPARARTALETANRLVPGSATGRLAQLAEAESAQVDDDEVVIVDDDDDDAQGFAEVGDEASFADVTLSAPPAAAPAAGAAAPASVAEPPPEPFDDDDDEPELVLDAETHDADELGLSDDDLVESDSIPPDAIEPMSAPPTAAPVATPAPRPVAGAALASLPDEVPERVAEALEEAEFYLSQQLIEEAREVLLDALGDEPGDKTLLAKLRELDALEEAATASGAAAPADRLASAVLEDQSFALAEKLAGEPSHPQAPTGPVDVSDVIAQFKEGVKRQVDKTDTATHYDLGIAYMEMGLHNEAIEEFTLCLSDPEKEHTAHTMMGLSHVSNGTMEQAIEHFKLALEAPSLAQESELELWFEIGNALELLGNASEALIWYEKVEERNPQYRDVAARIERLGMVKTPTEEVDEFDAMFDNMISKD